MRTYTRFWWWLIPLLLLTTWLGARGLNADALWGDEYFSLTDAGGPMTGPLTPAQIWVRVATENPWHTPGYFILLNAWARLTGWEPPILRALSLLFGLLAVAFTYRLGRETLSPRAGVYAAVIVGTSAFFVHFLHELRMYSLVALLTVFTIWAYTRVIRRPTPHRFDWLALFVGALGLLYIHYFAALLLVAIGAYHLLLVRKDRHWWQVVGVLAAAGVLFLPWLPALLSGLDQASDSFWIHTRALTAGEIIAQLVTLFSNGSLLLFIAVFTLALLAARGRVALRTWYFALALLALIVGVNAAIDIILAPRIRYLISLWAPLALVAALGLAWLARRSRVGQVAALALVGAWGVTGVWNSTNVGVTSNLDGAAYTFPMHRAREVMLAHGQPDDAVILTLGDHLASWMYNGIDAYYFGDLLLAPILVEKRGNADEQGEQTEEALQAIDNRLRVWVVRDPAAQTSALPPFEEALSHQYRYCGSVNDRADVSLDLYSLSSVCCEPAMTERDPLAQFGGAITLQEIDPLPVRVDSTLPVLASWSVGESVPPDTYSVALHVLDAEGHLVAQGDYGLPNRAFSCQRASVATSALPDGDYTLNTAIYAWQTGERLPVQADDTDPSALLPLGTFTVQH